MPKESQPGGIGREVYRSQFEWLADLIGGFEEPRVREFKKGNLRLTLANDVHVNSRRRSKAIIVAIESKDVAELAKLTSRGILEYDVVFMGSRAGVKGWIKVSHNFRDLLFLIGEDSEKMIDIRKQLRLNLIGKVREFIASGAKEIDPATV